MKRDDQTSFREKVLEETLKLQLEANLLRSKSK